METKGAEAWSKESFLPINHGCNKVASTNYINYRIKAFLIHVNDHKLKIGSTREKSNASERIITVTHY